MAGDSPFTNQRTEAGALLRSGLNLVTQMEIPEGKRFLGAVVVDHEQRVLGFAVRTTKGWEFRGEVSQEVQAGKKGIRVACAVVL